MAAKRFTWRYMGALHSTCTLRDAVSDYVRVSSGTGSGGRQALARVDAPNFVGTERSFASTGT